MSIIWPNGARIAVSLVVNVEEGSERSVARGDSGMEAVDEFGMFIKGPVRNYANETNYQFGIKEGAPRILRLLQTYNCPATFTACGMALEAAPDLARAIAAAGHEAAAHGYRWQFQYKMDEPTERAFIRRAADAIEATTGQRPVGWLSRYLPSDNTSRLLAEEGFLYHMDDFSSETPFWLTPAGTGKPIIILPYQLDTNDMKLWSDPAYTPRAWLDYLIDSFETLYEEGGKMLSVGLHLRITGRPARARCLALFLQHITTRQNTWITPRNAIATHFATRHPLR